jgi:putative membrane-bound dehydrogenase-like protein
MRFNLAPLCSLAFLLGAALSNIAAIRAHEPTVAHDQAVVEALLRLPPGTLAQYPNERAAVLRFLERKSGTPEYLVVAKNLGVLEQTEQWLKLVTAVPFNTLGVEAAKVLVDQHKLPAIESAIEQADEQQAASAVSALGYVNELAAREFLLSIIQDAARNRQLRCSAAAALGRSETGQQALLEMVQAGQVTEDIQFAVTDALLGSTNEQIQKAAAKLLKPPATATSEVIPPIQELAKRRGNAGAGQQVFTTTGTCSKCHKVRGEGKEIGPDLSEIGSKLAREDLFLAILNPSAAVSHNYETYTLLTADGQVLTGLLMNQNDQSLTIRNAEGIDTTVERADVEDLKKQSVSLMPADLQKALSLQNLIDVVEYTASLRRSDNAEPSDPTAGNRTGKQAAPVIIDTSHDPRRAVAGFDIADGLEVQVFAAEPQLLSPTSIDVDHLGRVWVCESVNYRHFRNPNNPERNEGDRILVLEDRDGDGSAEHQTVFYQGTDIDSPHGVTVLGNQIFVSAGSQVLVFTDQNNDLIPDSKRPLFTGISGVQHDHGIHAFNVGPDGKLYFNFGNEGKQLKSAGGDTIVDKAGNVVDDSRHPYQQGMVFRCNVDGSDLETLGWNFRNNWELCVDSFGNMWQSDNDDDGNRGTRINFVMEFGNYGYRDELTGDAWQVPRTGLEAEIPLQHWHLNDPGVVPNLLQTGAGSPTGICFYEGTLLPKQFQNQIIHTDPGPNVVRAYPVEQDGAGYTATILNMVQGVNDPWFRPVDVCAAPDGSLFVADWYDPGVGGHAMGDPQHGRIFRIVPTGHKGYQFPKADFSTAKSATESLMNPNLATRFLAQRALQSMGKSASAALEEASTSAPNDSLRARALWQLAIVSGDPQQQVQTALADADANLRIVGIRIAREHGLDVLPIVEQLKHDPSAAVRRELAIALRHNKKPQAAQLWAELAVQHDGSDRWYIEALGIGADKQWDSFFQAWLDKVEGKWNTPGGRDIVWRCRSPKACHYLAEIIATTPSEQEQLRYFRAFDFHSGDAKQAALKELLVTQN